jgi:hypothetical protein
MKDAPSAPVTPLYRPVGEMELTLIRDSGFRAFPPRLPEQPIFYPVLEESYAIQIARNWNTRDDGRVLCFDFRMRPNILHNFPCKPQVPEFIASIGFRRRNWQSSTADSSASLKSFMNFAAVEREQTRPFIFPVPNSRSLLSSLPLRRFPGYSLKRHVPAPLQFRLRTEPIGVPQR